MASIIYVGHFECEERILGFVPHSRTLILARNSTRASRWRTITCSCLSPRHWDPTIASSAVSRPFTSHTQSTETDTERNHYVIFSRLNWYN